MYGSNVLLCCWNCERDHYGASPRDSEAMEASLSAGYFLISVLEQRLSNHKGGFSSLFSDINIRFTML